jgi:hypothetical protein
MLGDRLAFSPPAGENRLGLAIYRLASLREGEPRA